jgi:cell shape-determining protein MreC
MLTRVCLIAAVVFGVGVAALNLWKVREVIVTTRTELNTTSNNLFVTSQKLTKTSRELADTQDELADTQQTLETTTAERDGLRNANDSLTRQNATLTQTLKTTTEERNEAQAELAAWNALGIEVDKVAAFISTAEKTRDDLEIAQIENDILEKELTKVTNELMKYRVDDYKVPLPVGLKGKVLVADPKWQFVVLDVGENDGVLEDGELLVSRNGRLVAKVRIQSVQKDRSIANLMNGWTLSDVVEGDVVIPAHVAVPAL